MAFAPFDLQDSSDGTLYSFSDEGMPGIGATLMRAAVASARFPYILPPYSVIRRDGHRWDFVDGGYADSTGAAAALDLYRALENFEPSEELKRLLGGKPNIKIKMILLTSAAPQLDLNKLTGTLFRETVAPINAVLKVRAELANQAVTRACDALGNGSSNKTCETGPSDAPGQKLLMIKLEEEAYELPLGWKISNTTFHLVSALIGQVDLCKQGEVDKSVRITLNNSCALKAIEQALDTGP